MLGSCVKDSQEPGLPAAPTGGKKKIVVLGASTAAGTGATPLDSSWVNRFSAILATNNSAQVINLANGGYTTFHAMPNGFRRPKRPVVDTAKNISKTLTLRPNLVLITFPSNDVANGYSNEEILANYSRMAQLLDSAKIAYIIFGSQPRNLSSESERQRLKNVNEQTKLKFSSHFNDYYDQLASPTNTIKIQYSFGDGVHLNNSGHAVILNTVINHKIYTQTFAASPSS